jgi:hypothetical protein
VAAPYVAGSQTVPLLLLKKSHILKHTLTKHERESARICSSNDIILISVFVHFTLYSSLECRVDDLRGREGGRES